MLPRGTHDVVFQRDSTDGVAYAVWFPATRTGPRMTFAGYFGSADQDFRATMTRTGVLPDEADALMRARTLASSIGTRARGSHDVVLLAQGNAQDAQDQAILAEFLATHGVVVITAPSPMLRTPMTNVAEVAKFAERQAEELEIARRAATRRLGLATGKVFVAGHSFGARAALFYAMQHAGVAGIISLDGGIGTSVGIDVMRRSRVFDSLRVLPPILHVYETQDAFLSPQLDFLLSLKTQRLELVRLDVLRHVHFTSVGFAAAFVPSLATATRANAQLEQALGQLGQSILGFVTRIRSEQ
jgi:pimeloyl-ACP methyl ester carboxylesterase